MQISCFSACSTSVGAGTVVDPHLGCGPASSTNHPNCVSETCSCVGTSANSTVGTGDGTDQGSCTSGTVCRDDGTCIGMYSLYILA